MMKPSFVILLVAIVMVSGCSNLGKLSTDEEQLPAQDVIVFARATKIAQLVGEYDRERKKPTVNLTKSRYKLSSTDLGVPFRHKDADADHTPPARRHLPSPYGSRPVTT